MRVEEIALRQEIRQMLNEAGINKNTLRDMAEKVMREEDMMRAAIKKEISEAVDIKISVKATIPQRES